MLLSIRARLLASYLLIVAATLALGVAALCHETDAATARTLRQAMAQSHWILVLTGLVAMSAVLAWWLTGRFLASVKQVRDAATHMAGGDLEMRVPQMGNDELGQLARTINTMADTIQSNLSDVLGEKNKRDAILSSLVDGVVTVTDTGKISFVNQVAGRILSDAAPDSLLGRTLADLLSPAPVQELLDSCASTGTLSREMALGERTFVVFAIPLGESGVSTETLILLRDVTSLRQLETARSQFLGNVSHELKTPLTIIKGFVITLLKSPGILDEWKRYLDFIDRETDRLSRLVDDLLNLARLRSKRTQMNFTFCEPGELLRETYRQLQAQAARYDSQLALDCPPNLPVLLADPDRFKEIIINLVDNAFKYTPPKGRVELSAEATPEFLHVRVRDHGPGIPEDEIPFLFERFFRGTDKAGRKSGGTGIGLAIVKEIVDAHRGRISVESQAGEGTTFDVALPLRQKGRRQAQLEGSLTGAPTIPASPPYRG